MNTGGKYDSKAFKKSVGLNGVGTKAVNALSSYFKVQSFRDDQAKTAEFEKGNLINDAALEASSIRKGTKVSFVPDLSIFPHYKYRNEYIVKMIKNYVYLNTGLTIIFNGEKYRSENGLKDLLDENISEESKLFPIIPVWSKEVNINGEQKLRGMFRYAKDPQRGYIYTQSAIVETVALAPKAPFVGTPKMFEGHESKWRTMNTELHPYLPYNPDELAPGVMPKRTDAVQAPMGLIEQAASRQAEKRNVIGLQEASLGKKSNETSGRAIMERRRAGDSVTFAYIDNLNRGIRQTGRVIIGMIPTIYSEERILRIIGVDGKEEMVPVNQPVEGKDGATSIADLTIGKHDIVVMTGPGYATQRIEFVDRMTQIMQYAPAIAALIAPATVEMMDIPQSEKVVKILEAMLPPQAQAALKGEDGGMTQEQVMAAVQQAVQEYQQGVEAQQEQLKTEQQRFKTEQEKLQTEQEKLQTQQEILKLAKAEVELRKAEQKPVEKPKETKEKKEK